MYILKVREKDEIIFEKEFDNFEKLMKKFNNIDFDSGKYRYSIYKNMSLTDILKTYSEVNKDDLTEIFKELKEVMKDLMKEGK